MADQHPLDAHPFRGKHHGLHIGVFRTELDAPIGITLEAFEGGLFFVDQGNDDIAIFGPLEVVMAGLVFLTVDAVPRWLSFSSGAVLAAIWMSTAFFYAPLHGRLGQGFDEALHRRLVTSNWLRTVAWTMRGVAAVWMLTF